MKYLWPAIEERYRNHPDLDRIGRKLVQPRDDAPDAIANHTVLAATLVDNYDDFATDTDEWELAFGLKGKSVRENDAETWLDAMIDHFVDQVLISPSMSFEWVGTEVSQQESPILEGHTFSAACTLRVIVSLTIKRPFLRGA